MCSNPERAAGGISITTKWARLSSSSGNFTDASSSCKGMLHTTLAATASATAAVFRGETNITRNSRGGVSDGGAASGGGRGPMASAARLPPSGCNPQCRSSPGGAGATGGWRCRSCGGSVGGGGGRLRERSCPPSAARLPVGSLGFVISVRVCSSEVDPPSYSQQGNARWPEGATSS